jgi:hypothetical protein
MSSRAPASRGWRTDRRRTPHGVACTSAPWLFAQLPSLAVYQAFFLVLRRWVRAARANGPFTHGGTVTLRLIGLLLMTATPVAAVLEALARGLLTATVTARHAFVFGWNLPGYAVVGGMGLVAVAEILHRGTTLREDLEATIWCHRPPKTTRSRSASTSC